MSIDAVAYARFARKVEGRVWQWQLRAAVEFTERRGGKHLRLFNKLLNYVPDWPYMDVIGYKNLYSSVYALQNHLSISKNNPQAFTNSRGKIYMYGLFGRQNERGEK